MSYTNPNGWSTPRTTSGVPPSSPTFGNSGSGSGDDWSPADGVSDVDMIRIETNIKGLHTLLCQSGTIDVNINTPYFTAVASATLSWTRINNVVHIAFPDIQSTGHTDNNELQIEPDTIWPSEILPTNDTLCHCLFYKDQTTSSGGFAFASNIRTGYMLIPSINSSNIICYISKSDLSDSSDGTLISGSHPDDDGEGFSDKVGSSYRKGIPDQTITYIADRPSAPAYA